MYVSVVRGVVHRHRPITEYDAIHRWLQPIWSCRQHLSTQLQVRTCSSRWGCNRKCLRRFSHLCSRRNHLANEQHRISVLLFLSTRKNLSALKWVKSVYRRKFFPFVCQTNTTRTFVRLRLSESKFQSHTLSYLEKLPFDLTALTQGVWTPPKMFLQKWGQAIATNCSTVAT